MTMIADPTLWADPSGALLFWAIVAAILLGTFVKLFGQQKDDWIDERSGRGSVRDDWLLSKVAQPSLPDSSERSERI
jgi:hypothetical protein